MSYLKLKGTFLPLGSVKKKKKKKRLQESIWALMLFDFQICLGEGFTDNFNSS